MSHTAGGAQFAVADAPPARRGRQDASIPRTEPKRARRSLDVDRLWLGACIAGFLVLCWVLRRFVTDDAWITIRYAENVAEGRGFVWSPGGPRVEGFSNPLLVAAEAPARTVGLDGIDTARGLAWPSRPFSLYTRTFDRLVDSPPCPRGSGPRMGRDDRRRVAIAAQQSLDGAQCRRTRRVSARSCSHCAGGARGHAR